MLPMDTSEVRLLHQDGQLLVVHKPAGWTIYHEDGVPKSQNLQFVCQDLFGQKLHPVHRLDRATCGIVVFATDGRWARELHEQFDRKSVKKKYLALVDGAVKKAQRIEIPLKDKSKRPQSAFTKITPKSLGDIADNQLTLVELDPETGRFHQLRKHCKLIGHVIVGDSLYGKEKLNQLVFAGDLKSRLMLSAVSLSFSHPRNKKELRINDIPDISFNDVLKAAGIKIGR
jgi:tRNA pseudouridine65 synthase